MPKPKLFLSHVAEEAPLAEALKFHLGRDFLGLVDIFVSSDLESIAAGTNWLSSLEQALRDASVLLVLCSRASLSQPWVNFEVGAAWIKPIPIVPVCHSGLRTGDLPIPFSVLQGVQANTTSGLKRVYSLVAGKLNCEVPQKDFTKLVAQVAEFERLYSPQIEKTLNAESERQSGARSRVYEALADAKYHWRSIERLAVLGGITEHQVLGLLAPDPNVILGKSKDHGKRIARLKRWAAPHSPSIPVAPGETVPPPRTAGGMLWALGSYRGLSEVQRKLTRALLAPLAAGLIGHGLRVVMGESDMLEELARRCRDASLASASAHPATTMLFGSLRRPDIRDHFRSAVGAEPGLALLLGGNTDRGRSREEYEIAVASNVPVLAVPATGGVAAEVQSSVKLSDAERRLLEESKDTGDLCRTIVSIVDRNFKVARRRRPRT